MYYFKIIRTKVKLINHIEPTLNYSNTQWEVLDLLHTWSDTTMVLECV